MMTRKRVSSGTFLAFALCVVSLVPSSAMAQMPASELAQAEQLFRRGAWTESEAIYSRVLADTPMGTQIDGQRRRAQCRSRLIEIHRRLGNDRDALLLLLEEREALQAQRGPDIEDLLQRNAVVLAECRTGLDDFGEARATLHDLLDRRWGQVKAFLRIQVLIELAIVEQRAGLADAARNHWRDADQQGRQFFAQNQRRMSADDSTLLLQRLVECQEALADVPSAKKFLELLLGMPGPPTEAAAIPVRQFMELGMRATRRHDFVQAESHFREALKRIDAQAQPRQKVQIHQLLAHLLTQQKRTEDARAEQTLAAEQLQQMVAQPQTTSRARLEDLKQLRELHVKLRRIPEAVLFGEQLVEGLVSEIGTAHPLTSEARGVLGGLYGMMGAYAKARPLLEELVVSSRKPGHLPTKLAQALNNLGAVERGVGELKSAGELFEEALQLRLKHLPSDHPDLATSYHNLASVALAQGQFKRAILLYQQVLERCVKRGRHADGLRSATLLNLAMAYQSQGQWDRATDYCKESLELLEEVQGKETLSAVGHYNALAVQARCRGQYAEAYRWANKTLAVCAAHHQDRHAAVATARAQIGIIALLARELDMADEQWQQVLRIQRDQELTGQVPATLNMLGMLAYQRGRHDEAQGYLEEALDSQNEIEITPRDRYNALCNLAAVRRHQQRRNEALGLLDRALEIPETIRSETFGDAEQGRARFLAQFASAYEMRVQWHLDDGNLDAAFRAAEQNRNRTFLDQLNLAGVDLRSTLPEDAASRLLPREQELRIQLNRLRQEARLLAGRSAAKDELIATFDQVRDTQAAYAKLWSEVRDSSQLYQRLLTQTQQIAGLDELRRSIGPDALCLFYQLGTQRSVVLVFGNDEKSTICVPLRVATTQAATLPELPLLRGSEVRQGKRGPGGTIEANTAPSVVVQERPALVAGELTRRQTAELVTWYRQALTQRQFDPTRGPGGTVETTTGTPVATTAFTTIADILFPAEIRRLIRERNPRLLVVVPDGALHNLPFEALLISAGDSPSYVLDEFPAITYAPSLNILSNLQRRPYGEGGQQRRLLTVGSPQYGPASRPRKPPVAAEELSRDAFLGLSGALSELPGSASECERLLDAFQQHKLPVLPLLGESATESRFVQAVRGQGIIHLAAHGLVDERHGNLFGAIALTPVRDEQGGADDGLLTYNEILHLPLQGCELAVLSACQTNVGPDRPMEAGATLAQAFFAAGVRRVVASQWSVSDSSTVELMETFFRTLAASLATSSPLHTASALHGAKQKVRNDPRWQAPYFWAPFVLLGPGE